MGRLPDYIIVEGPLAGGHLGFGLDWANFDLKTITGEVIAHLKQEGLEIPVIMAGGIFTGTDAVEFLETGSAAVQVATRFTVPKECGLPEKVKQEYFRSNEEDIEVNMISPTESGHFFCLDFDTSGAMGYRDAIRLESPFLVSAGDSVPLEPGNMVGPTVQGVRELIAGDPDSAWNSSTNLPDSSRYSSQGGSDAWMGSPG